HVDGVVQPAVPGWRHGRGFRGAVVDHPAPLEVQRRVDLAALGAVVAVAELVLAHELAEAPSPQLRAEGLAIPPGEEAQQKGLQLGDFEPGLFVASARSCHRRSAKSRTDLVCRVARISRRPMFTGVIQARSDTAWPTFRSPFAARWSGRRIGCS